MISVVMCVHNGENYIRDAVASVQDQAGEQTEIVIVDDGSTDATSSILAGFGSEVRVITSESNRGIGESRNLGLDKAIGDYIVFFDHDDLLPPDSLMHRRLLLEANPDADLVSGLVDEFLSPEVADDLRADGFRPRSSISGSLTAIMVRRAAIPKVGRFEQLVAAACMNWMIRARQLLTVVETDQVVLHRRLHQTNISRPGGIDQEYRFEALRRARRHEDAAGSPGRSQG